MLIWLLMYHSCCWCSFVCIAPLSVVDPVSSRESWLATRQGIPWHRMDQLIVHFRLKKPVYQHSGSNVLRSQVGLYDRSCLQSAVICWDTCVIYPSGNWILSQDSTVPQHAPGHYIIYRWGRTEHTHTHTHLWTFTDIYTHIFVHAINICSVSSCKIHSWMAFICCFGGYLFCLHSFKHTIKW